MREYPRLENLLVRAIMRGSVGGVESATDI
jgi:hypothetical protein